MVAGGYAYGYLFISQNSFAEGVFKELLSITKPNRILEIGTMHGGLTLMLRDIMDELELHENIIRTYDINDQEFLKPLVTDRAIEIFTTNLFNKDYSSFGNENSLSIVRNFIRQPGLTMVLCDGGCKKCEFNLIAPLLKTGDIIMAHDYAPNSNYFETHMKDKIWDWLEIQNSDIIDAINECGLVDFHENITQQAAWCCKIRSKE